MKPLTIFYSWQSDLPAEVGERFIDLSLKEACSTASRITGREIRLDRDTLDVPGTPPITETILGKIRSCDIFCADMTFVGHTAAGKPMPNPNVMGEYGYALNVCGHERIMLVMNSTFGPAEKLPFDLHHMRHPISFEAHANFTKSQRAEGRTRFAARLAMAIEGIVRHLGSRAPEDTAAMIEAAGERLDRIYQWIGQSYWPILIGEPRLHLLVAPVVQAEPQLEPVQAVNTLGLLAPCDDADFVEGVNGNSWWRHAKARHRHGLPNPEARWYVRLFRDATVDVAQTLGFRIDDDREIAVDATAIERAMVEIADRMSVALGTLWPNAAAIVSASISGSEDLVVLGEGMHIRRGHPYGLHLGRVEVQRLGQPLAEQLRPLMDKLWLECGRSLGSPSFSQGSWTGYQ